jgi:hypothetical protein
MTEKSAIQRIKELDDERAKIFDQAKTEALEKAQQAVAQLNALGLSYKLTSVATKAKPAKRKEGATTEAPCPICAFMTAPAHDGRSHRSQKKKAPFTAAELKDKGMVKLSA